LRLLLPHNATAKALSRYITRLLHGGIGALHPAVQLIVKAERVVLDRREIESGIVCHGIRGLATLLSPNSTVGSPESARQFV
jgi:hypothetical protein